MKKRELVLLVPLAAFYLCVGCSARSAMVAIDPLQASLRPYTSVRISVESMVDEDVSKEVANLERLVVSEIKERGTFQNVALLSDEEPLPGTLLVDVAISEVNQVSSTKRFM